MPRIRQVNIPEDSPNYGNVKHLSSIEQIIYARLLAMRKTLSDFKINQNCTRADVTLQSDNLATIVQELANFRESKQNNFQDTQTIQDPLDYLITHCSQLILELYGLHGDDVGSLLLPVYNQLIALQNGLDMLKMTGFFTLEDVQKFQMQLNHIENMYVKDQKWVISGHSGVPKGQAVLFSKLNHCYRTVAILLAAIDTLADELLPIHTELISISSKLEASIDRSLPIVSDSLIEIQSSLDRIDDLRINNHFVHPQTKQPLQGEELVIALLESCYEVFSDLLAKNDRIGDEICDIYHDLKSVFKKLQELDANRWECRAQDLIPYQRVLNRIENQKVNGIFYGTSKSQDTIPSGQATLHHLLHKNHALIYSLQCALDPIVDPAIQGIHHHLVAIRRCILQLLRFGGPFSANELYPFQMKLAGFDDLRSDGKFIVDGEIVRGQGVLIALLEECYDILNQLRAEPDDDYEDVYEDRLVNVDTS